MIMFSIHFFLSLHREDNFRTVNLDTLLSDEMSARSKLYISIMETRDKNVFGMIINDPQMIIVIIFYVHFNVYEVEQHVLSVTKVLDKIFA